MTRDRPGAVAIALPPATLSEADWAAWVIDVAVLHGWVCHHSRPARTAQGWRTAVQGHAGLPDLVLARRGDLVLAELKTRTGQLRPAQRVWLDHLGPHGVVWRPGDAAAVYARLTRPEETR